MPDNDHLVLFDRNDLYKLASNLAERARASKGIETRRFLWDAVAKLDGVLATDHGDTVAVYGRLGWLRAIGAESSTRHAVSIEAQVQQGAE